MVEATIWECSDRTSGTRSRRICPYWQANWCSQLSRTDLPPSRWMRVRRSSNSRRFRRADCFRWLARRATSQALCRADCPRDKAAPNLTSVRPTSDCQLWTRGTPLSSVSLIQTLHLKLRISETRALTYLPGTAIPTTSISLQLWDSALMQHARLQRPKPRVVLSTTSLRTRGLSIRQLAYRCSAVRQIRATIWVTTRPASIMPCKSRSIGASRTVYNCCRITRSRTRTNTTVTTTRIVIPSLTDLTTKSEITFGSQAASTLCRSEKGRPLPVMQDVLRTSSLEAGRSAEPRTGVAVYRGRRASMNAAQRKT